MKKLLLTSLCVLVSVAAYGQGQVNLANTPATLFTTNRSGVVGNMSGANQWRIGLYTGPAGSTLDSQLTLLAVATNSSLLGGRIGSVFVDTPGTSPIAYQVKAWSLAAGASYEAAVAQNNANFMGGKSPIGGVTPAGSGVIPPVLFTSTAGTAEFPGQLTAGITLVPLSVVPEPSTIALGLLGLGAIALFRRRK